MMNDDLYEEVVAKLKILSHAKRLGVMCCLLNHGECNVTTLQKMIRIPQPTLSQHLMRMQAAGIIKRRRNGMEVLYSIADSTMRDLINTTCPNILANQEVLGEATDA